MHDLKDYKISIIIVNYNGLNLLDDCLKSINKQLYKNYEVIIVDNNSTDKNFKKLPHIENLKIVELEYNSGVSDGHNIGYKYSTGDLIFLLNNDTILSENNILTKINDSFNKYKNVDIIQPIILDKEGKIIDSVGSQLTIIGQLYHHLIYTKYELLKKENYKIFIAKGAAMIIRKNVIQEIGLFDKRFFAYYEDADFSHRAILSGKKIILCSDIPPIFHIGGATAKKFNINILFHDTKNKISSYYTNFNLLLFFYFTSCLILINLILAFAGLIKLDMTRFFVLFKAIKWNIFNLTKLNQKKFKIRKIKIKNDLDILKEYLVFPKINYFIGLVRNKYLNRNSFVKLNSKFFDFEK